MCFNAIKVDVTVTGCAREQFWACVNITRKTTGWRVDTKRLILPAVELRQIPRQHRRLPPHLSRHSWTIAHPLPLPTAAVGTPRPPPVPKDPECGEDDERKRRDDHSDVDTAQAVVVGGVFVENSWGHSLDGVASVEPVARIDHLFDRNRKRNKLIDRAGFADRCASGLVCVIVSHRPRQPVEQKECKSKRERKKKKSVMHSRKQTALRPTRRRVRVTPLFGKPTID